MGIAAMILGPAKDAEAADNKEGDEYETVAAEIILGINERRPALVAKGLKAFIEMCACEPDDEDFGTGD